MVSPEPDGSARVWMFWLHFLQWGEEERCRPSLFLLILYTEEKKAAGICVGLG